MKIHYVLADPTANRTVLVTSAVQKEERLAVAERLMRAEPTAEQLGFVDLAAPSLQMAGGEFCGNASMSAAALYARVTCAEDGERRRVVLQSSGAGAPVPVSVRREGNAYFCSVEMPRPLAVSDVTLPNGEKTVTLPLVRFAGISHLLCRGEIDCETAEKQIAAWCDLLGVDALGVMFLSEDQTELTPLVYVPRAGTLFWENSCAGGTTAYGAWRYAQTGKPFSATLTEPGGTLAVSADADRLLLYGKVIFEKETETEI